MAGIGFELKKVVERGGIGAFLKAALSGTMIVAGPWIISIFSIYVIRRLVFFLNPAEHQTFIGVIVYSYAISLVVFGGMHFVFTRLLADLIFKKKERTSSSLLIYFLVMVTLAAAVIGGLLGFFFSARVDNRLFFSVAVAFFFIVINLIWILMLFVSLLRWYGKIFAVYVAGMITGIGLMFVLSRPYGLAGGIAGFAAGHFGIALGLFVLSLKEYPPGPFGLGKKFILPYLKKYRHLFFTGQLYNLAIWIDKIIFWVFAGTSIGGTVFRLYEPYDVSVYLSNLTMVPGLVFFVISVEPQVFVAVRKFLISLRMGTLRDIQRRKYRMLRDTRNQILSQVLFQGVVTGCFLIIVPFLRRIIPGNTPVSVILLSLLAVFSHFLMLILINVHFYLEFYRYTYTTVLLFLCINAAVSLGTAGTGLFYLAGAGYFLGAGIAAAVSARLLFIGGKKVDRYILSGTAR
jgi:polysaccharide biosynthesis protein PelG